MGTELNLLCTMLLFTFGCYGLGQFLALYLRADYPEDDAGSGRWLIR